MDIPNISLPAGGTPLPAPGAEDTDIPVVRYPELYWGLLAAIIGVFVVGGLGLHWLTAPSTIFGQVYDNGLLFWMVGAAYLVMSTHGVSAQEIAGIFVFSQKTIQANSIWVIVPLGFAYMIKRPIVSEELETPADPELIYRGDGIVPPGMRPPTRITFAEGADKDSPDPLEHRVTAEVPQIFIFRIDDFFTYYVRVGDDKRAIRRLEDIGVALISEELPKITAREALTHLEVSSQKLLERVQKATKSWGVSFSTARNKQILFSHELNKAIQKRPEALANKSASIIDGEAAKAVVILAAEGSKQRKVLEGEGDASAVKSKIDARTDGLTKQAKDLGVAGKDVLAADVALGVASSPSSKTFFGKDGLPQIMGIGSAIADTMGPPPAAPTPNTPATP